MHAVEGIFQVIHLPLVVGFVDTQYVEAEFHRF